MRRLLARARIRHTARLLGVYDFSDDTLPWMDRAARWLAGVRTGDVLMVHPATRIVEGDPLSAARVREFAALGSPAFGELMTRTNVVPERGSRMALQGIA